MELESRSVVDAMGGVRFGPHPPPPAAARHHHPPRRTRSGRPTSSRSSWASTNWGRCHSCAVPSCTWGNALMVDFGRMQKLAEGRNIQESMEAVYSIDDGFTRDVLNSCVAKNQITKEKY
ncbi:unnamed protein product [Urochloa humidicola]